jgi:type II secretory pathway predicted ATPase ExeA
MYCEYWKLDKSPFDNVPDPSMYVDSHVSMENVISETIFAIREGNESFAVIIGDIGLGKTLSLRIIIDALESEKYKIVLITNPSISFVQLLKEIIGQITGQQCEEKRKSDLLELFNRLLFETSDKGQKIVIFIDEANVISSANLENLRLLTNMQDDQRNLFTLILAGQLELAHRLEHPRRANLYQRIGTYGRIDKLPSEEAVKSYIETRLKLAGAKRKIFDDDAIPVVWENSEHGIPRLINKICKLCLKAGETNELQIIHAEVAAQIAERFQKLSKAALQKRKPRNRPESDFSEEDTYPPARSMDSLSLTTEVFQPKAAEIDISVSSYSISTAKPEEDGSSNSMRERVTGSAENASSSDKTPQPVNLNASISKQSESASVQKPEEAVSLVANSENEKLSNPQQDIYEEVLIRDRKVTLRIPNDVLEQAKSSNRDSKSKLAGYWAAQIVKDNSYLTQSALVDPVAVWHEIKNVILEKMNSDLPSLSVDARTQ